MTQDKAYGDAMLAGLLLVAADLTRTALERLEEPARSPFRGL